MKVSTILVSSVPLLAAACAGGLSSDGPSQAASTATSDHRQAVRFAEAPTPIAYVDGGVLPAPDAPKYTLSDGKEGRDCDPIAFEVPKGFRGVTPELGLRFVGERNAEAGLGWALEGFRAIERSTTNGTPAYSSEDGFIDTSLGELARSPSQDAAASSQWGYRPGDDGEWVIPAAHGGTHSYGEAYPEWGARHSWYKPGAEGHWVVRDADGPTHYFGAAPSKSCDAEDAELVEEPELVENARAGYFGPTSSSSEYSQNTFRYMIRETRDNLGHCMTYRYERKRGYPLPIAISYAPYRVYLTWEPRPDRVGCAISYVAYECSDGERFAGFELLLGYRLQQVRIMDEHGELRSYRFAYAEYDPCNQALPSRLSAILELGPNGRHGRQVLRVTKFNPTSPGTCPVREVLSCEVDIDNDGIEDCKDPNPSDRCVPNADDPTCEVYQPPASEVSGNGVDGDADGVVVDGCPGPDADWRVVRSEQCPEGYRHVTLDAVESRLPQTCALLGRWSVVRLAERASAGGEGNQCRTHEKDTRRLGQSLCEPASATPANGTWVPVPPVPRDAGY